MAHDALHADVLRLLAQPAQSAALLPRLETDAARYRDAVQDVRNLPLPQPLGGQLARLRSQQNGYIDDAERLGRLATVDIAAARQADPAFEREFEQLEAPQAAATNALATLATAQMDEAERQRRDARNLVRVAALIGIGTLLSLTVWLVRLGSRLTHASRQRAVAETLQRSLLPGRLPDCEGLEIAARYQPVSAGVDIGGDWYNVFLLRDGAVGLVMGDVAGHDVAAATVMGQLRTAVQAYALEGHRPADVLRLVNEMTLQLSTIEFATCVYAVLDADRTTLRVANAGHYPPLLVGSDRPPQFLDGEPTGPPLGAMAGFGYTETCYPLPEAFRILLFTDGLVERRGADLDEALHRLAEQADVPTDDLQAFCDHILSTCLNTSTQSDDVALLAVAGDGAIERNHRGASHADPPAVPTY
jgi:serine phosphatase RsbU (regulator of sigma subunit)